MSRTTTRRVPGSTIDEAKAFVDVEAVIPVRGDDDHFVKFVVIVR